MSCALIGQTTRLVEAEEEASATGDEEVEEAEVGEAVAEEEATVGARAGAAVWAKVGRAEQRWRQQR